MVGGIKVGAMDLLESPETRAESARASGGSGVKIRLLLKFLAPVTVRRPIINYEQSFH